MIKQNFDNLVQNEDKTLEFAVTINGEALIDVIKALFVVRDRNDVEVIRYTLNAGVLFADSVFTVYLKDTETQNLNGKFKYELWFGDSLGKDTGINYGFLKFKTTFGRYL
jgi:hypothetical protein